MSSTPPTSPPTSVVITGSTGRLGQALMSDFQSADLNVRGVDANAQVEFSDDGEFVHRRANLTSYGETVDALQDAEVVVHLANISYPGFQPDHTTYTQNVTMNYNVFSAASLLKVKRVVWLSTANVCDIQPGINAPERFPITEDQPTRLSSAYALSKASSEISAAYFGSTSETAFIGIRSTLIVYPSEHAQLRQEAHNAELRHWHYWSYIDVRDLTRLIRSIVVSECTETTVINATAADTTLEATSGAHCAALFPDTPCNLNPTTHEALFSGTKATQLFDFKPQHSWRDAQ